MQVRLEEEMRQRQELAAQLDAERTERQAQAQRLTDITEFLQGLGQHVGFSLPARLLVPVGAGPMGYPARKEEELV